MVSASAGKSKEIAEALAKISGVKSAHSVTGRFDVIAQVEALDLASLGELVLAKIQAVEGVVRTETALVV